jgi:hypothetical protein
MQSNDRTAGISVIIPCWRDKAAAFELARRWANETMIHEVIVAGVGEDSPPPESPRIKFCASPRPGRGAQLNLGASLASGEVLLFHHVDSDLLGAHLAALRDAIQDRSVMGGAFYRKFDERHPWMKWAERIERWHSRTFGALYGDQSIFVRREHFNRLGGFASIPLMEDVEFSRRLRRSGKIVLLDPPMSSSPAKQIAQGSWRTTLRNMLFLVLFRLGVSAELLHSWYYRARVSKRIFPTDKIADRPERLAPIETTSRS